MMQNVSWETFESGRWHEPEDMGQEMVTLHCEVCNGEV